MKAVEWLGNSIRIIDQTLLPAALKTLDIRDWCEMVGAIKELKVRGAPAIGVAAAYGIALGAQNITAASEYAFLKKLEAIMDTFAASRPTAVNLFRSIDRMKQRIKQVEGKEAIIQALIAEAHSIHTGEIESTERLSYHGAELIRDGFTILTHCNAGPLATAGYGTALGVIIAAHKQGKNIRVLADETRPLLQGARLTVWELMQEHVPVTLITDSMAGYFINRGKVNCVITGADRITTGGDTANKIGTYTLAVLAKENGIPFYIAAPASTIDPALRLGGDIPIEERNPEEVTMLAGVRIAPSEAQAANPAFDVTPSRYITGIITERGVIGPPYDHTLPALLKEVR